MGKDSKCREWPEIDIKWLCDLRGQEEIHIRMPEHKCSIIVTEKNGGEITIMNGGKYDGDYGCENTAKKYNAEIRTISLKPEECKHQMNPETCISCYDDNIVDCGEERYVTCRSCDKVYCVGCTLQHDKNYNVYCDNVECTEGIATQQFHLEDCWWDGNSWFTHNDVIKGIGVGGSLQGYVTCTYAHLVKILGYPSDNMDDFKSDAEWQIKWWDGEKACIYNYKDGKNYLRDDGLEKEDITDWHIGGESEEVVARVLDILKPVNVFDKCHKPLST